MADETRREPGRGDAHSGRGRTARTAGDTFQALVDLMTRLRAPDGCPWDREQTYRSLRSFVLEETYEVLEAIDREDFRALEGELGDFVFEAVFLAQIAAEEGRFTISDSIRHVVDKLIRRHPHVNLGSDPAFSDNAKMTSDTVVPLTPAGVLEQWEQIKGREQEARGERKRVLGGVTRSLPALLRAYEIGNRVAAVGFDWSRAEDVIAKVREEVDELSQALGHESKARAEEEMGDLLFAIANLARKIGIEPESALRQANEKFTRRFEEVESRLEARGRSVHDATLEEMENEWAEIKRAIG